MTKKFQIFQEFPRGLAEIPLFNLRYFGYNFETRNARKSFKLSKDSYYSLLSNKSLSQKNGSWRWHPGPDDVILMKIKCA